MLSSYQELFINETSPSTSWWTKSNGSVEDKNNCFYDKGTHLIERFYFITVCGSTLALWATINNTILVYLLTRHRLFVSQFFYLAVLAAFDILICLSYVLLFSVQNLYDVYANLSLYEAWIFYLKPVFAVSHVSMTVSTYMICAASAERYLTTTGVLKRSCLPKHRAVAAFCIFCFSVITKGVVYWELDVIYKPNCTQFEMYELRPSDLAMDPFYRQWYVLWFRHIVHVFLPFISLIVLNTAIIMKLKRTPKMKWVQEAIRFQNNYNNADNDRRTNSINQRKKNIRQATLMLVVIASTYLVSNLLNVIITALENFYRPILLENQDFYSFSTDVVSLLTVLTSAIRLPTYYIFNKQVRREIHLLLKKIFAVNDKNGELELTTSTIA